MREIISLSDYSNQIMKELKKGVLITTKASKVNSMVISWGMLGIEWNEPIFITFVRDGRFTNSQLEKNPEFTVNIPICERDKRIFSVCGTKSGYKIDKIKELGLTLEEGEFVSVPAIKELPLTLECKVIYKQLQDKNEIKPEYDYFYPQDVDSEAHSQNKDFHIAYYGKIVDSYILK